MATTVPQCMVALKAANDVRHAGLQVKRAISTGEMSVGEAVWDARAGSLTVFALLVAQQRWGRTRALRMLTILDIKGCTVRENKRIRDLTDRQRAIFSRLLP